jgi:hypothetical protein
MLVILSVPIFCLYPLACPFNSEEGASCALQTAFGLIRFFRQAGDLVTALLRHAWVVQTQKWSQSLCACHTMPPVRPGMCDGC